MKKFISKLTASLLISGMMSSLALADQCALIPQEYASKALDFIKPGSQFVSFCEPCGDENFETLTTQTVNEINISKTMLDKEVLWEIKINGKGIDLAYTFMRNTEGSFLNLSKLANCPSHSVSVGFSAPDKPQDPEVD